MGSSIEETSWSIYQIITLDGEPYCVMQKWELHRMYQTHNSGSEALERFPTGDVKVVALRQLIDESNQQQIAEEIL